MKWIVGVSVMAIVMGWAATTTIPAATITPDEAILKLLPAETQGVAFIDVAALRNAPLVKEAQAKGLNLGLDGRTGNTMAEFMAATGFDPERDLDKVTVGMIAPKQTLVVAQARYDRIKVEQFVKDRRRISSEAHLGRTIYVDGDKAFTFIDNLVILGEINAVKKAIDQMSLPGSQPLRSDIMDAIRTIEAGSQVWAVGDLSMQQTPLGELRGPAPALEMIKSLQSGTYEMRVDRDVHARAVGNFADAEAARNLSDTARGFIALAKLQVGKEQDLLHLLDGIQVQSSGTSVVVNVDEPGDLLMKLKDFRRPERREQ
jgi:hypothetical protein